MRKLNSMYGELQQCADAVCDARKEAKQAIGRAMQALAAANDRIARVAREASTRAESSLDALAAQRSSQLKQSKQLEKAQRREAQHKLLALLTQLQHNSSEGSDNE